MVINHFVDTMRRKNKAFAGNCYPDILLVSKGDDRGSEQGLGRYKKMPGTISNNRPVWEHEDGQRFVFSTGRSWMVGRNWKGDRGWFKTALQEGVPDSGWQRGDGESGWSEDPLLRVDGKIHE